jgi:hypothetical protein
VPNLHYTGGYLALIMATVVLFALAHRRLDFTNLLLVFFFFHQSINYVRHLPLFCIVAPPLLAALPFRVLPDSYLIPERLRTCMRWGTFALFAGLSLFEIRKDVRENWLPLVNSKGGYLPEFYPSLAVKVIKQFRPEGRMFNQINYAGFLIWELAPEEYKLFTDPRFDIFGSQFMHESHAVRDAIVYPVPAYRTEKMPEDDWRKKIEEFYAYNSALGELGIEAVPLWRFLLWKWDAGFLVLDAQSVLASVLHNGDGDWDPDAYERDATDLNLDKFPRWREVFFDGKYGIYVKDIPRNRDLTKKRVETWAVGMIGEE